MAKAFTVSCPNCGAGLQTDPRNTLTHQVSCQYCGTLVTMVPAAARKRTALGVPPVPTGPNVVLLDKPEVPKGQAVGFAITIGLAALLPMVIGLFAVVANSGIFSELNSRFNPNLFPLECETGREVVIRKRNETRTDAFVFASTACTIRIVDSKLSGPYIVKEGTGVKIIVENSELSVSKAVFQGGNNSSIELRKGSKVYADDAVFDGAQHSKLTIVGSVVESKGSIFKSESFGEVNLKEKSRLKAAKHVLAGANSKLTVDNSEVVLGSSLVREGTDYFTVDASNGSTIQSEAIAIVGGSYGTVRLSDSKLTGMTGAVDMGRGTVSLLEGATISSRQDAVRMGDYGKVEVGQKARIESGAVAIRVGGHSDVSINGGMIKGIKAAIMADDYTTVRLRRATVTGVKDIKGRYSKVIED